MRILIFEPNAAFREDLAHLLEGEGHQVTQGARLAEAFAALRTSKPQMVVSGVGVSAQDTVLAAAQLKAMNPQGRFLALIPDDDGRRAELLEQVGVQEVLHGKATTRMVRDAIQDAPKDLPALTAFGKASDKELRTLESLFKDSPDNLEGQWLLGFAYYRAGEFSEAVQILQALVRRDPGNMQARYYMGSCYFRMDRPNEAIAAWQKVVDREPRSLHARKAKQHIDKALKASTPPARPAAP